MSKSVNGDYVATPVVADGRVDAEKLSELMSIAAEHDELDFKSFMDLSKPKTKLNFVKDCIAMMNTPNGGYIVIGLDGRGNVPTAQPVVDAARFDPADLASLVEGYVDAPVMIRSGIHEREGRPVIVVFIGSNPDGLPSPTTKAGAHDGGNPFEKGVFFTRNNTRNVTVQAKHMPRLFQRFRAIAKAEAHEESNRVIAEFVRQIQESNSQGLPPQHPPLLSGGELSSLAAATVAHLHEGGSSLLDRFVREQTELASFRTVDSGQQTDALDSLAVVAIESLHTDNRRLFSVAIDSLLTAYESAPSIDTYSTVLKVPQDVAVARYWLDVISRVMLVGAIAVTKEQWWALPILTCQPIADQNAYSYSTWFRHAGVFAARANLIPDRSLKLPGAPPLIEVNAGPLLSRPRMLAIEKPELRDGIAPPNGVGTKDPLLDALAQFDLAWCVLVAARSVSEVADREQFYPSFAALAQSRSQPMMSRFTSDHAIRNALLAGTDSWDRERVTALALKEVLLLAQAESKRFGTDWPVLVSAPDVAAFIERYT